MLEDSINNIITALYSDPVYLIIGVILAALILYSLVKKLVKLMLYLLAILIIYIGYLYFTGQDLPKNVNDIMATNIQIMPINRPKNETGALSPYPTVVIVTADHQNPSIKPEMFLLNCCEFCRRSKSQIKKPKIKITKKRPPI